MYTASKPSKISRVDLRYRHQPEDVSPEGKFGWRRKAEPEQKEEEIVPEEEIEPLFIREEGGRAAMGRSHRMFHRRQQPEEPNVLTVGVEVVATVDPNGNTIIQETRTPVVDEPGVPTVPAVPPFPTDLVVPSVPAFPFPSGVPSPSLIPGLTSAETLTLSLPTPISDFSTAFPTLNPSNVGFNSTSTLLNTFSSSSTSETTTRSSSLSQTTSLRASTSLTRSSSTDSYSSRSSTRSISSSPSATTWSSSATSTEPAVFGGGGVNPAGDAPGADSSESDGGSSGNDGPAIGTPRIVGSVIGSLAGTALLLWLILFLIKRHKRKGALQLSGGDTADGQSIASSGQQMATRNTFVPAGVPSFLNRFSGASRSTIDSTSGERGFQRISGRKLPSAFSEGMTSEQFARGEGTLSGSSFYQDDRGFYGGPGIAANKEYGSKEYGSKEYGSREFGNKEFGKKEYGPAFDKEIGEQSNYGTIGTKERIMPSPARTPVVHHPDDASPWGSSRNDGPGSSPPATPNLNLPLQPSLGRSHPSHDGSRSSRFTENV